MKKKLTVSLVLAMVLITSVVSAGTIEKSLYDNKKTKSNYVHLGSGRHVLRAQRTSGSGSAHAMKVIKWAPDKAVATVFVSSENRTATSSFNAASKVGDVNQSYYIRWRPSPSSSKAYISITH